MARPKRWNIHATENGVGRVDIYSWRYFMDFVYQRMLNYETYIWRGHRCDNWLLEPTSDRFMKELGKPPRSMGAGMLLEEHLERFKYAVRGRRGSNPPALETDNDWWALGQHNSLVTPLLDWTTSPFTSAYFAFIRKAEPQTAMRAVFALHRPSIESKVEELQTAKEKENERQRIEYEKAGKTTLAKLMERPVRADIEFVRPMSDENPRLVNQGALFTRGLEGIPIEEWVGTHFKGDKGWRLLKILIPNKDRRDCLRTLNRMNINHLTLFPDLYGASVYCNVQSAIPKY